MFLDTRQIRQREQIATPAEYHKAAPWWDGFSASVGHVIDEEWSISSGLNRDAERRRNDLAKEQDIDLRPYSDRRGRVDWDKVALDHEGIPTSAEVNAERNEYLRMKREYANDVKSRAPDSSQFMGAMTGYLLDPVSVATMPAAYTVKGAQGLSLLSRIALTAGKAAAIEGATEAAIQLPVYQHKVEIGSPWEVQDSITNVALAATGAAALGGITEGISGYLKSIRKNIDPSTLNAGERKAYEAVQRVEDYLEDVAPEEQAQTLRDLEAHVDNYGRAIDEDALPEIVEPAVKAREGYQEIAEPIEQSIIRVGDGEFDLSGMSKARTDEVFANEVSQPDKGARALADEYFDDDKFEGLPVDSIPVRSIIPTQRFLGADNLDEVFDVGADTGAYLLKTDEGVFVLDGHHRIAANIAHGSAEIDAHVLDLSTADRDPDLTLQPKESEVLERTGLSEGYDQAAKEYKELPNKVIVQGEEVIAADDVIKTFDDEIDGLENVMRCVRG